MSDDKNTENKTAHYHGKKKTRDNETLYHTLTRSQRSDFFLRRRQFGCDGSSGFVFISLRDQQQCDEDEKCACCYVTVRLDVTSSLFTFYH